MESAGQLVPIAIPLDIRESETAGIRPEVRKRNEIPARATSLHQREGSPITRRHLEVAESDRVRRNH